MVGSCKKADRLKELAGAFASEYSEMAENQFVTNDDAFRSAIAASRSEISTIERLVDAGMLEESAQRLKKLEGRLKAHRNWFHDIKETSLSYLADFGLPEYAMTGLALTIGQLSCGHAELPEHTDEPIKTLDIRNGITVEVYRSDPAPFNLTTDDGNKYRIDAHALSVNFFLRSTPERVKISELYRRILDPVSFAEFGMNEVHNETSGQLIGWRSYAAIYSGLKIWLYVEAEPPHKANWSIVPVSDSYYASCDDLNAEYRNLVNEDHPEDGEDLWYDNPWCFSVPAEGEASVQNDMFRAIFKERGEGAISREVANAFIETLAEAREKLAEELNIREAFLPGLLTVRLSVKPELIDNRSITITGNVPDEGLFFMIDPAYLTELERMLQYPDAKCNDANICKKLSDLKDSFRSIVYHETTHLLTCGGDNRENNEGLAMLTEHNPNFFPDQGPVITEESLPETFELGFAPITTGTSSSYEFDELPGISFRFSFSYVARKDDGSMQDRFRFNFEYNDNYIGSVDIGAGRYDAPFATNPALLESPKLEGADEQLIEKLKRLVIGALDYNSSTHKSRFTAVLLGEDALLFHPFVCSEDGFGLNGAPMRDSEGNEYVLEREGRFHGHESLDPEVYLAAEDTYGFYDSAMCMNAEFENFSSTAQNNFVRTLRQVQTQSIEKLQPYTFKEARTTAGFDEEFVDERLEFYGVPEGHEQDGMVLKPYYGPQPYRRPLNIPDAKRSASKKHRKAKASCDFDSVGAQPKPKKSSLISVERITDGE